MARSVLSVSRQLMRRRKFILAIRRLESRSDIFEGDFEYYLLLGIAYLYIGDTGSAKSYFDLARKRRTMNTELLLGQAALFLQRGDIARAVPYYTDILEDDPQNKVAQDALEFIRITMGKDDPYAIIRRMVDTRKIERFYPPLGFNTDKVWAVVLPLVIGAVVCLFVMKVLPHLTAPGAVWGQVAEASSVEVRHYVLTDSEIRSARKAAKKSLGAGLYPEAMVEANRLLNSNALEIIKGEARDIKRLCYPAPPMFETAGTSYTYQEVADDPLLYDGCFVVWKGLLKAQNIEGGKWRGVLQVATSETSVGGSVRLVFDTVPKIDMEREATVLGRISITGGNIVLDKAKVHQSLRGKMETPE